MKSSGYIFDCISLLHYKCHKINPRFFWLDEKQKSKSKYYNYDDETFNMEQLLQ